MAEPIELPPSPIDKPVDGLPLSSAPGTFPTEEEITSVLMAVEDPEMHISIIDLGLVYKINREPELGKVTIDMTLTTPACPYGPQLLSFTHSVVSRLPNVKEVKVNPVWTPKWDPHQHASDVGKMMLGLL